MSSEENYIEKSLSSGGEIKRQAAQKKKKSIIKLCLQINYLKYFKDFSSINYMYQLY